ncbi:PucR family transcriptional regulator ligand-binding domain-containing protein [Salinibacterium sp. TMP30]|uniref:PucR family transcriptional regulator n=1 Tax=Salinibacterium sp. TMP30 TaxID=3138237 RepID=UPI0031395803
MAAQSKTLRVDDIVSTTSLDVRVLAGGSGLARDVLWAHSCEMKNPDQWLGPHELLMTVGLCVPAAPADQVAFLRRLDEAGLAGLMIGDHEETAPPISDEMLREANLRGFPVLLAGAQTPYAVVARHVAAANTSSQTLQVLKLSKLYHLAANANEDAEGLVHDLVALLGIGIRVEDPITGLPILAADLSRAHVDLINRDYPLRGAHAATLIISEHPGEELDSFLLVHVMKVLEVTIEHILNAADRRAEIAARVMLSLLNGAQPPEFDELLAPHSVSTGFQIAAFAVADGDRVARAVALRELPIVVGAGRTSNLALIPIDLVPEIRKLIEGSNVRFGASSVFTDLHDVRIAAEEAAKVLAAAQHSDRAWTEFEGTTISVLARSNREAAEIITGVLGPLAETASGANRLRETLFAYLRNDRRWNDTANELGIHRQTLSYRLNRIEAETGSTVTKSSDLSAFWIAYQAWEAMRG